MAEQLGRGSYTKKEKSGLSSQAQGGMAPGINQGTPQGGGGGSSMFSGYGDASKSRYDDSMVNSLVNFVGKMNEAQVVRNMEEQQLFGMQAAAKGIALDEVKKSQPGLSKFFGDTFVLEGARVYTGQDNANKMTLAIEQNWEEWKELPPDEMRKKYMELTDSFKTGDARTDTTMLATSMQNFGKLSAKHYTDNFEWQQDKLMGAYIANATTKAAQYAKEVENESDPEVIKQKGTAFARSLVAEMPPTLSDDRKAKVLAQTIPNLVEVPGGAEAITGIVSDMGASNPEVLGKNPGFMGVAVTTATNLKAIGAKRMAEHDAFRDDLGSKVTERENYRALAKQALDAGDYGQYQMYTAKADEASAYIDQRRKSAGLNKDLSDARNAGEVQLILNGDTYESRRRAAEEDAKVNSSIQKEANEYAALNAISNAATEEERQALAAEFISKGHLSSSLARGEIKDIRERKEKIEEKYYDKEAHDSLNARRSLFDPPLPPLSKQEYIDEILKSKKQEDDISNSEKAQEIADADRDETIKRQAENHWTRLRYDGTNNDQVIGSLNASGWFSKSKQSREQNINDAFHAIKDDQGVVRFVKLGIADSLGQDPATSNQFANSTKNALANGNLGQISQVLQVFSEAKKYANGNAWLQNQLPADVYNDMSDIYNKYPNGFEGQDIKVVSQDVKDVINNVKLPKPVNIEVPISPVDDKGNYLVEKQYPQLAVANQNDGLKDREGYSVLLQAQGNFLANGQADPNIASLPVSRQVEIARQRAAQLTDVSSSSSRVYYNALPSNKTYGKTLSSSIVAKSHQTGSLPRPEVIDKTIDHAVMFDGVYNKDAVLYNGEKIVSRTGNEVVVSGPKGTRTVKLGDKNTNYDVEGMDKPQELNVYHDGTKFMISYLGKDGTTKYRSMSDEEFNFRYALDYEYSKKGFVEKAKDKFIEDGIAPAHVNL